jgi:hypothetical protein
MRTEDILRFEAELRVIRQAFQAAQIEASFPSRSDFQPPAWAPVPSSQHMLLEARGAVVSRLQGRPETGLPSG